MCSVGVDARPGGGLFTARAGRYLARMQVQVSPAAGAEEPRLRSLFELYTYDFSELLALDVGDDGRFAVPSLAVWWGDPRRHPLLVRVDGRLAGFALVGQGSRLGGDLGVYDMAEFFVLRRYRRRGVGERAAAAIFGLLPGRWEVRQRPENAGATVFWRRIIGRYTGQRFDDLQWDDERWRGPVQRFTAGA